MFVLSSQEWTSPNTIKFKAKQDDGKIYFFHGSYYQPANLPYSITIEDPKDENMVQCEAFPFLSYEGKIFVGDLGKTHDDLFYKYIDEMNFDGLKTVEHKGITIAYKIRDVEQYTQQGRAFVFTFIESGKKIVVLTTWKDDADDTFFENCLKEFDCDNMFYIHLNNIKNLK